MSEILQKLPLGTTEFDTLRQAGEIYVDKTPLIERLAEGRRKLFYRSSSAIRKVVAGVGF